MLKRSGLPAYLINRYAALIVVLALVTSGCATTRSIINVDVPTTTNPSDGTQVKISRVTDQRKFEVDPGKHSTPSLKGGDIHNRALTLRVLQRKVNLKGELKGDVLLPKGRTVEHLVTEAVELAFRQAGFPVLTLGDPGYDHAVAVSVDIEQFWAWQTFSLEFGLAFEVRLLLAGGVGPFQNGEIVHGQSRFSQKWGTEEEFLVPVNRGLEELVENIRTRLIQGR